MNYFLFCMMFCCQSRPFSTETSMGKGGGGGGAGRARELLKSAIRNGTELNLNLLSNLIGNSNDEGKFLHK